MSSENSAYSGVAAVDIPQLVELLHALDANCWDEIPPSIVESLTGLAGLKRLVAGLTIVLIDHGGTDPKNTSDVIADLAPDLFEEFGESFVTALCQEVQESELPKQ